MAVPASLPRFSQPGAGLILFRGDAACLTVGLLVSLRAATPNRPLLVVDGANSLDPYLLADLARRLKQPPAMLLASVFISRLFTAYQLEAAIVDRLDGAIDARRPSGVLLAGLLDLLYDEDVDTAEARRILRRILTVIQRLAAGVLPVIATCPVQPAVPGREGFLPHLAAAAAWVFAVAARDGAIEISGEKPTSGHWRWEPEVPLLAARRFY
ncbi:MAG: hypothetical protein A2Z07_10245 [Armatimonadetes bacterium RBG_16_67_12]|nr:MAG: hypothetical protein A2Z07_10245 [Armatimonadetes bacterium RBG_16_67_12]